jgi:hypothetical protein
VLFAKYNQNDHVKEDEIGCACSTHGENGNTYRILVGKPEGKRPDVYVGGRITLPRVVVTIDGVSNWILDLLATYRS